MKCAEMSENSGSGCLRNDTNYIILSPQTRYEIDHVLIRGRLTISVVFRDANLY